jgi:hypothetical protein
MHCDVVDTRQLSGHTIIGFRWEDAEQVRV